MRRALVRLWATALWISLPYRLFLWHRTDYLGHVIAGFGATLLLLCLPPLFRRRMSDKRVLATVLLAIAFGFGTEMTIFKIAKFDPVDFANQSLGACIAGLCLLNQEWVPNVASWVLVSSGFCMLAGIVIAHG